MKYSLNILYCCFILIDFGQSRNLWSADLPEGPKITLEKDKPIAISKNFTEIQLCDIDGSILYSDTLSQLKDVKELRICRHQIRKIENGALCSLSSLKILDLEFFDNTDPPTLTKEMFENCQNLEELLLKFDNIYYPNPNPLNKDAFEGLSNLKKLAIQGYKFNHLDKNFLKVSTDNLKELVLSSGHIKEIDSDVFDNFENLEELYIIHNSELTRLPKNLFRRLSKLKKLVLRDNGIKDLTWEEFQGLFSLEELSLVDNQISSFDTEKIARFLPKLKQLEIEINPIPCKDKETFVNQLKAKYKHAIEVSYKFDPGYYDSCEQQ